jgi:hypothetical protein
MPFYYGKAFYLIENFVISLLDEWNLDPTKSGFGSDEFDLERN